MPRVKRPKPPRAEWVNLLGNSEKPDNPPRLVCQRCQEERRLALPVELRVLIRQMEGFSLLHADCPEPATPPTETTDACTPD